MCNMNSPDPPYNRGPLTRRCGRLQFEYRRRMESDLRIRPNTDKPAALHVPSQLPEIGVPACREDCPGLLLPGLKTRARSLSRRFPNNVRITEDRTGSDRQLSGWR